MRYVCCAMLCAVCPKEHNDMQSAALRGDRLRGESRAKTPWLQDCVCVFDGKFNNQHRCAVSALSSTLGCCVCLCQCFPSTYGETV